MFPLCCGAHCMACVLTDSLSNLRLQSGKCLKMGILLTCFTFSSVRSSLWLRYKQQDGQACFEQGPAVVKLPCSPTLSSSLTQRSSCSVSHSEVPASLARPMHVQSDSSQGYSLAIRGPAVPSPSCTLVSVAPCVWDRYPVAV